MDTERKSRQAVSFGQAADVYDRARPTYPDAAIDWLLPRGATRVLDLGAGTGKLTRALAARGLETVAVDPSPEMLDRLKTHAPATVVEIGRAEAIPLPDASVDAVLVAQAWHWVDPALAVPEVARVLRPGGTLGLVWNARDDRVAWVADLNRIMDGGMPVPHYVGSPKVGAPFAPLERHEITLTLRFDETQLLDLMTSRSYFLARAPDERQALLDDVHELFARLPRAESNPDQIVMPYVTRCFRTRPGSGVSEQNLTVTPLI